MFESEVCNLPATGRSTALIVVAAVFVLCGVLAIRWVRHNSHRLAVFAAPLILVGGLTLLPQSSDCLDPSSDAPALSVIQALPLAVTPLLPAGTVNAGDPISVNFSGFDPNEIVQLVVASNPQVIGWVTSSARGEGTLTGTIPASLTPGEHTLVVYSPSRGTGSKQVITVVGSSTTSTTATTTTSVPATTTTTTTTTTSSTSTTSTTTSTTLAPTSYAVGDIGPGGGVVFYVHPNGNTFTSTGSACGSSCRYLELAPTGWGNGNSTGCSTPGTSTDDPLCAWSDTTTVLGTANSIGSGYSNTELMVLAQQSYQSAATISWNYSNNGTTDWFLPSKDEINEMCKFARNTGQPAGPSVGCSGGSLPSGYFGYYWTSSEHNATDAIYFEFNALYPDQYTKAGDCAVRPIRAF